MKSNEDILKAVAPKILINIGFIILIIIFKLNFFLIAALILTYVISLGEYNYVRDKITGRQYFTQVMTVGVLLCIIYIVSTFTFLNPLMTSLLLGIIIAFFILITRRHSLLDAIRHVEKKHFGETMEEKKARLNK